VRSLLLFQDVHNSIKPAGGKMRAYIFVLISLLSFTGSVQAMENTTAWSGPHALRMERASQVIDGNLAARLASLNAENTVPVMVFFSDKGLTTQSEYLTALETAEASLTSAARERRLKSRGLDEIVDFRDLPVYSPYITQTLATGARLRQTLKWFNAVSVDATKEQAQAIASLPYTRLMKMVAGSPCEIELPSTPSAPTEEIMTTLNYGSSAGQLNQINAITAHELGFKGQGVIVCMMDVGYKQNHAAFQNIISSGRRLAQYDFINHDFNTDFDPSQDIEGQADHGTATWSTLGGEATSHLYGPSYLASFILAKTEDISSERHIEEDNWAAGAQWADSIGASVISSSLGYRVFNAGQGDYQYSDLNGHTAIVTIAAALAAYNGITVCNAMGNEGNSEGSLIAPADADSILSCGAVDNSGILANFSSWGPTYDGRIKPEVCAQGMSTACADPNNLSGYTTSDGTSLSTPLVGGASGVLLSAHPNWTNLMVREALMMTASKTDSVGSEYGWGIMDVGRALYYHPQGDIVFDFHPLLSAEAGQPISFGIDATGGEGIIGVLLYWRNGTSGDFTELQLNSIDSTGFLGQIPGQTGTTIQYYFKAFDSDSNYAFYPIGGLNHPFACDLGATQFTDNFDNGLLYWESGGTKDSWGLNVKYARSNFLSATDSPTGNYKNGVDSWLQSKFVLDLSRVAAASFSFYWRGVMQSSHDSLHVEASSDGGTNWTRIGSSLTGSIFSFTQSTASLTSFIGHNDVRLRFHFVSDATGQREGVYLDDATITWTPTGVADNGANTPIRFSLNQNYPNPFNPTTMISFSIPVKGQADLSVYDLLGRRVKTLVSGELPAGQHNIVWDGRDEAGHDVASGVYLYKLEASGVTDAHRMTLLR
jgi:hypothetical protein